MDKTDKTPVTIVPKSLSSGSISSPPGSDKSGDVPDGTGTRKGGDVSNNTGLSVEEDVSNTRSGSISDMKPPNVLIYCGKKDSSRMYEAAKKTIELCLNSDKYLLYHLRHDDVDRTPWADNTQLVVICSEKVYDGVDKRFYDYFLSGGTVISFSSAFDNQFISKEQVSNLQKIKFKIFNFCMVHAIHMYTIL